jgi:hypothetical protein
LAAALLLAAGSAWAGGHQDRSGSRSNDSGGGGGRTAIPRAESPSSSSGSSGGGSSWGGGSSSSGSSGHRTAVPRGSDDRGHGPNRQPPTYHRGGGGRHGGYYGGGYYGGYYPYYGPYYGWGYWPRAFWGWYWDDYYWGGGPYPYPSGGYGRYSRDDMGALDLDISPGRTEVYLDGQNIGTVDDFDGWPQYLWLPKGTYDIAFYLDGYKTLARQVSIYPGLVIDMDDRMEPGQAVLPQDLQTKIHERRDERIQYERERSDRIDRERSERPEQGEDWRGRVPPRGEVQEDDADGRAAGSDSGWLRLDVDPEDASVYLDGRFVGTGSELGSLQRGLRVDAGEHHLAVVRPGREPEEKDFEVAAGQEMKLSIDLDPSE